MRHVVVLVAMVALAAFQTSPSFADDAAVVAGVTAARAALGKAFAGHDDAEIRAIYAPDHISVSSFYGSPLDVDEQIAAFFKLKETIVETSPIAIVPLGPEAALVNFENAFRGTFAAKPLPSRVFVSEIWLKLDGRWRQRLYQETPIE